MMKCLFKISIYILLLVVCTNMQVYAQTCATYQPLNNTLEAGYNQVYWVTSTADNTNSGTLRWAITQANANAGSGTMIKFCFDVLPATITLTSMLPRITAKVKIDGTVKGSMNQVTIVGYSANNNSTYYDPTNSNIFCLVGGSSGSIITALNMKSSANGIVVISITATIASGQRPPITDITITDNYFYDITAAIHLEDLISSVKVYRNLFGAYKLANGTIVFPSFYWGSECGIEFQPMSRFLSNYSAKGNIHDIFVGSGNMADRNFFYTTRPTCLKVKNSLDCELGAVINSLSNNNNYFYDVPTYNGTLFETTSMSDGKCITTNKNIQTPTNLFYNQDIECMTGKSPPNARIDLYVNKLGYQIREYNLFGTTVADANGNWSMPRNLWVNPSDDVRPGYYYVAMADNLGYSSETTPIYVISCLEVKLDFDLPTVVCKNSGVIIPLSGTPAGGTFSGQGVTGSTFNPANVSPGLIDITYTIIPTSQTCLKTLTKQILVPPLATPLKNVLSISASTATDAWPIDGNIVSSAYGYGTTGVKFMWAPEEDYAYVDDRVQTNTLQTRTDGLLQNVPMFNWKVTSANSCYANWRKVNTITQVNSGTGQLENRDILNNYSAALYGYNDQLSTAVVSNASYKEIAFDSFEEYAAGSSLDLTTLYKTNLTLVTSVPSSTNLAQETNFEFDIIEARDNVLTIKYPYSSFTQLIGKQVGVFGAYLTDNSTKNIHGYYNLQKAIAGTVAGTVVVTLTDFAMTGLWNGKIAIPFKISEATKPAVFTIPSSSVAIATSFTAGIQRKAHSGKQFLKITANAEMEQVSLRLIPLKKYVISTWVSADVADANTYASGTDRRLEISFLDASGAVLTPTISTDYMFVPSGLIIEGWQRLEGVVTVPANATRFTIKFATPTGTTTYFDDIRFFPFDGNMESYVYNNTNYKLISVLDQNNYATYYYYDEEGALYLVKKETELGVQTLQEVYKHSTEANKP